MRVLLFRFCAAALLLAAGPIPVHAYALSRSVFGDGGATMIGESMVATGTAGQSLTGTSTNGAYVLHSGWWNDRGIGLQPTITVDVASRRIETSRLRVVFNAECPERIDTLVFKDDATGNNLRGDYVVPPTVWFYGATIKGFSTNPGFILPLSMVSQSWQVLEHNRDRAQILISSRASGEPPVKTYYTFFARAPYYIATRTLAFSQSPYIFGWQVYLPCVLPFDHGLSQFRFKQAGGYPFVITKSFAACSTCTGNWNNTWVQNIEPGVTVSLLAAPGSPPTTLAGVARSVANATWTAPYMPQGTYNEDITYSLAIHFATAALSPAEMDALYNSVFLSLIAVEPGTDVPVTSLRLTCQREAGGAMLRLNYVVPHDGQVVIEIFNVRGHLIREVERGFKPAGNYSVVWGGQDRSGAAVASGVYFARLRTAEGTANAKGILMR